MATPYSKYPGGIEKAFVAACRLTGRLLKSGWRIYSPIAHTHPIAVHAELDAYDHAIWLPFDEAIMERSDWLWVATMPSWQESRGIAHEIEFFKARGKPIDYLDPDTMQLII